MIKNLVRFIKETSSIKPDIMLLSWSANWSKELGLYFCDEGEYVHIANKKSALDLRLIGAEKLQCGEAYIKIIRQNEERAVVVADFMFGVAMTLSLHNGAIKIDGYQGNWKTPYGFTYAEQIGSLAQNILNALCQNFDDNMK